MLIASNCKPQNLSTAYFLITAVFIRVFTNPAANVFQKKLTRDQHPLFINTLTYFILALVSLLLLRGQNLSALPKAFWIFSVLGGIAGALGNGFIIRALETGDLSVLGPINAWKSIVGLIIAFLLIGELPNAWGFLGVALIFIGSYFVLDTGPERFHWGIFKQPAIKYRLLALVLTGTQAVFDKRIIQVSDQTMAFVSWCVFGFLFSALFLAFRKVEVKKEIAKIDSAAFLKYIALAACVGIMTLSTNYCFAHMPVGEALALFQLSILLSVFFGYHFFQERDLWKKLVGAMIMIGGSMLIILLR
jgi:drug/metabolite transporter (DMT)-like permease